MDKSRTITGSFHYSSPDSLGEGTSVPVGWFVIRWQHVQDKAKRRRMYGKWYRISCNGRHVYRAIRFAANLEKKHIILDWMGWIELQREDEPAESDGVLDLEIRPASRWGHLRAVWQHPDPTHRLAGRMALLSLGLGVLSVAIALLPWMH